MKSADYFAFVRGSVYSLAVIIAGAQAWTLRWFASFLLIVVADTLLRSRDV